jgi:predicted CDP-diglyceride synthetase/phosphatidate cytidylyltransferase
MDGRWNRGGDEGHAISPNRVLIPGHGGIMDRFDALVFVAPIAWLGLKLLG